MAIYFVVFAGHRFAINRYFCMEFKLLAPNHHLKLPYLISTNPNIEVVGALPNSRFWLSKVNHVNPTTRSCWRVTLVETSAVHLLSDLFGAKPFVHVICVHAHLTRSLNLFKFDHFEA